MTTNAFSPRSLCCLVAVLAAIGCGKDSAPIQPTASDPPTIVCGASVSLQVERTPAIVEYAAPRVTGGAPPLTTSCTIPVGGSFPLGTTDVVCSATDAQQRRAQCVLQVKVSLAPKLQGTRFLAFGDSITEGEVSTPLTAPRAVEPQNSYPTVLQGLLRDRYVLQSSTISVFNRGMSGEKVGEGEQRLVDEIGALKPDVVLLMQGANDVNGGFLTPSQIATSLGLDINRAYRFGVKKVFISTLLPQVAGRSKAFHPELVDPVNLEIFYIADREGAVVVDAFQAFNPQKELLIGIDGLHPTAEGYRRLAELFRDVIGGNFDVPVAPTGPQSLFSRPARLR